MSKHWNKNTYLLFLLNLFIRFCGDTESSTCGVINIRLKRKDERRSRNGNPWFMTSGRHCPYLRYLYYFCIFTDQHFYYIWFRKKIFLTCKKTFCSKAFLNLSTKFNYNDLCWLYDIKLKLSWITFYLVFLYVKEINFVFVLA